MPRKKKVEPEETIPEETPVAELMMVTEEEPMETDEDLTKTVKEKVYATTPKEEKLKKPSDTVKVKVKVGTLHWEGGWFEKGTVFECSRQRASRFEPNDVEIIG